MKISVGTANFGMTYGATSNNSALDVKTIRSILDTASDLGIKSIDTAYNYGESQALLGQIPMTSEFAFTTKLPVQASTVDSVEITLENSLKQLNTGRLHTVLFHSISIIKSREFERIMEFLSEKISEGIIGRIGVSVYETNEIVEALERHSQFSVFQINENILDRSKKDSEYLHQLSKEGVDFSVRSVFLQGLLINDIYPNFLTKQSISCLKDYRSRLRKLSVSELDACISYARSIEWASHLVVGIRTPVELVEISKALSSEIKLDFDKFPRGSNELIDPRKWRNER